MPKIRSPPLSAPCGAAAPNPSGAHLGFERVRRGPLQPPAVSPWPDTAGATVALAGRALPGLPCSFRREEEEVVEGGERRGPQASVTQSPAPPCHVG